MSGYTEEHQKREEYKKEAARKAGKVQRRETRPSHIHEPQDLPQDFRYSALLFTPKSQPLGFSFEQDSGIAVSKTPSIEEAKNEPVSPEYKDMTELVLPSQYEPGLPQRSWSEMKRVQSKESSPASLRLPRSNPNASLGIQLGEIKTLLRDQQAALRRLEKEARLSKDQQRKLAQSMEVILQTLQK